MNKIELIKNIEKSLRQLAEVAHEDYINAVFLDGAFMLDGRYKDNKQNLHYYNNPKLEEELKNEQSNING